MEHPTPPESRGSSFVLCSHATQQWGQCQQVCPTLAAVKPVTATRSCLFVPSARCSIFVRKVCVALPLFEVGPCLPSSAADALSQGLVYNAVDGCAQLGLDGEQMDKVWAVAKKAGKLVKFGGGFYCGLVVPPSAAAAAPTPAAPAGSAPIYVINGFYMAMPRAF